MERIHVTPFTAKQGQYLAFIYYYSYDSSIGLRWVARRAGRVHAILRVRKSVAILPSADDMAVGKSQDVGQIPMNSYTTAPAIALWVPYGQQHAEYIGVAVVTRGWIVICTIFV
jgi:hypothetical protein